MSHDHAEHDTAGHPQDDVEAVVPFIPYVVPLAGAIMMFLLAFIAVTMA